MHFGWRGERTQSRETTTISIAHLVQSKWLDVINGQNWWKIHDWHGGIPLPNPNLPDLVPNRASYLFREEAPQPEPIAVERPHHEPFHNQYSRRGRGGFMPSFRQGGSSSAHEERRPSPTFEQGGPSSTYEFGGTSHTAPPPPPPP